MIRQFCPGVWIDPEEVRSVTCLGFERYQVNVTTTTGTLQFLLVERDEAVAMADEIGNAARIAQKARLAADTRLRSPIQCPECGSAERIGLAFGADGKSLEDCARRGPPPTWPTDDAGRSE